MSRQRHTFVNHFADPDFWFCHRQLPDDIRELADKSFALPRENPRHPSLRLKKVGILYSARIGLHYRALAREYADGLQWFWIGHHSTYDQLLRLQ